MSRDRTEQGAGPADAASVGASGLRHVAVLLPSLAGGGAELVAVNLAREFVRMGLRTDLVVLSAAGPMRARLDPGVRLVDLGCDRALRAPRPIARYLDAERPDAALSLLFQMNAAAAAGRWLSRARPPLVTSVRNPISFWLTGLPGWARRPACGLFRLLAPQVAAMIAVTEGAAEDFAARTGYDRGRIAVLPNPTLDPDRPPLPRAPAAPPVILCVGRLSRQKNQALLLRAFALLAAERDCRLALLGDGPDRPMLEALADRLGIAGRVRFAGHVPDPRAEMAQAAALALTSSWEGSPNVIVEAMAAGLPVVATDCPTGPREVLEGGRWGRLVPMDDPAALAEALAGVLDGRGVDARARADRYRADVAARAYLEVLARAARDAGR